MNFSYFFSSLPSNSICIHMSIKNPPFIAHCTFKWNKCDWKKSMHEGEKKKNLFSGNKSPSNNASSLLL
jgi:hypothetical protein